MVGLPDGEKIEDIYNGLDTIPVCDRQTDRRIYGHLATAYMCCAYASRSKNGQGKLNMHIIFDSVLMLFTKNYQG